MPIFRPDHSPSETTPERDPRIPDQARAAVFVAPNEPLELRRFALPRDLGPGAVLCRVRLSTICGSDLHTTRGRRQEPMPSILGHESVGEIAAMGGPLQDGFGEPLGPGDRVTWTIMASCRACFFCAKGLPQKCVQLRKYGHTSCEMPPGLTGGYAEYIYLYPGTTLFRVPDALEDRIVAPANCALATVVNALETIGVEPGDGVLIEGMGLLGLYLVALVRQAGATRVLVTDRDDRRLRMAVAFGATAGLNVADQSPCQVAAWARHEAGEHGVDAVFEVCGHPDAAIAAIAALRVGGRLLIAGLVTPQSRFELNGNQVTRKCLTIKGIHNYRPDHLGTALRFLETHYRTHTFERLVSRPFPLDEINAAFDVAEQGEYPRVAVRCTA